MASELTVAMRVVRWRTLLESPNESLQHLIKAGSAQVHAKSEHPFWAIKRRFGFQKTRLCGLVEKLFRCQRAGISCESVSGRATINPGSLSWQHCFKKH